MSPEQNSSIGRKVEKRRRHSGAGASGGFARILSWSYINAYSCENNNNNKLVWQDPSFLNQEVFSQLSMQ
jgi:hypothetical protein